VWKKCKGTERFEREKALSSKEMHSAFEKNRGEMNVSGVRAEGKM